MERTLPIKEAAKLAGVTDETIRRWIKRGVLRAVQPVPRGMILIPASELERILEAK